MWSPLEKFLLKNMSTSTLIVPVECLLNKSDGYWYPKPHDLREHEKRRWKKVGTDIVLRNTGLWVQVSSLIRPMPAGLTTSRRVTTHCATSCTATAQPFQQSQISLLSSGSLVLNFSTRPHGAVVRWIDHTTVPVIYFLTHHSSIHPRTENPLLCVMLVNQKIK